MLTTTARLSALTALTLLTAAGCVSATRTDGQAGRDGPSRVTSSGPTQSMLAQSTPTGSTTPTQSASSRPQRSHEYVSTSFVLPLTVTVAPSLSSPPHPDARHLLSWEAADSPDRKVRFLAPVVLYRPAAQAPSAVPQDYGAYLRTLTKWGVHLDDITETSVDGHPATLMTVTSDAGLNGALGCPQRDSEPVDGCFGPQTDLSLRLAVANIGGTTFLAWARTTVDQPDPTFVRSFERMVRSVRFRR